MCEGLGVELRQQFSYEYSTKKNIWNIWNILLKGNYAQFSNWGSQKEKYSKYPTQGKTLCAMGWALSYDSNFPINILHCRGLDLLIYTLSCVFIKTKDHLSYFHLIFIMCINNSDKTNLTNTCSGWISSFFCYITYKYFLTLESQGVYCQIKWK